MTKPMTSKMKMIVGKDKQKQISAEHCKNIAKHYKSLQNIAKEVQIQAQLVSVALALLEQHLQNSSYKGVHFRLIVIFSVIVIVLVRIISAN